MSVFLKVNDNYICLCLISCINLRRVGGNYKIFWPNPMQMSTFVYEGIYLFNIIKKYINIEKTLKIKIKNTCS